MSRSLIAGAETGKPHRPRRFRRLASLALAACLALGFAPPAGFAQTDAQTAPPKPAEKPAEKKPATKPAPAKKAETKKPAAKSASAKKTEAKKPAAKKSAAKAPPAPIRRADEIIVLGRQADQGESARALLRNTSPVRLNGEDQRIYARAFRAAAAGEWGEARRIAARARDSTLRDVVAWADLRRPGARRVDNAETFGELTRFVEEHPTWPDADDLRRAAENAYPLDADPRQTAQWFERFPPLTGRGVILQASAIAATRPEGDAIAHVRRVWRTRDLDRPLQTEFRRRFGAWLRAEDHRARLDRLIWLERYTAAADLITLVGPDERALANARIGLAQMAPNVEQLISRVPSAYQNDPGLLFERLRWRRKKDFTDDAIAMLNRRPDAGEFAEQWWEETQILARRKLNEGDAKTAYRIASTHEQTKGAGFAEAEWLAGWIALRFLNKPDEAFDHFEAMYRAVQTSVSKSRGAYWAGRAAAVLRAKGEEADPAGWYRLAAEHPAQFYGQLAKAELAAMRDVSVAARAATPLTLPKIAPPTKEQRADFESLQLARIALQLYQLDEPLMARAFLVQLGRLADDPVILQQASRLAADHGDDATGLRIARDASRQGVLLAEEAFPVLPERLWPKPAPTEPAVMHAVIRQESLFRQDAVSSAGARGLMQLMPGTARDVSKALGVPYREDRLITDVNYNLRLGSTYVAQMIDRYDGSLPIALAAYNAGPGRASQWLRDIGDPRVARNDRHYAMIDWIERIPIYETRNYVQRVLENASVYRARINGEPAPLAQLAQAGCSDGTIC
jgi:soluble lytic murein transglycosylase